MNKLIYTEEKVFKVDYNDLDQFIKEEYGVEYESAAYEEWSNYQSHEKTVQKEELDEFETKELENFKGGKPKHYMIGTILKDLVNRDRIPEGDYVISVFW